jgi:TolA-binding protein
VRSLGYLQPRGAASRSGWMNWRNRPESVSALTLLAALQIMGEEDANRLLFGNLPQLAATEAQDQEQVQEQLDELRRDIEELKGMRAEVARFAAWREQMVEVLRRRLGTEEAGQLSEELGSPSTLQVEAAVEELEALAESGNFDAEDSTQAPALSDDEGAANGN